MINLGTYVEERHGRHPGAELIANLEETISLAEAWKAALPEHAMPTDAIMMVTGAMTFMEAAARQALRISPGVGYHVTPRSAPDATIDAAANRDQLNTLTQEMEEVKAGLAALETEATRPAKSARQPELLQSYLRSMRVPVAQIDLHLLLGHVRANITALARAIAAMARLTESFAENARSWQDWLSAVVTNGAKRMLRAIGAVSGGMARIMRGANRSLTGPTEPTLPAPGPIRRDGPDFPEMVLIPQGRFLMGIPMEETRREGTAGIDHEARPVHVVLIERPFWIARFPLTRGEYAVFCKATGHNNDGKWRNPGFEQTDRDPVVNVSHQDAIAYISWLNTQTKGFYRLPSEAEWEYAARAGTQTARFWGSSLDNAVEYVNGQGSGTAPVDQRRPNGFGLYDMLGNVWEWCADPWHGDYKEAPSDGSVWTAEGSNTRRVLRGGSWDNSPRSIRAGVRNNGGDDNQHDVVGFRPARSFF
jgi:formylglycine-generating enzyme required for sulfatase activity